MYCSPWESSILILSLEERLEMREWLEWECEMSLLGLIPAQLEELRGDQSSSCKRDEFNSCVSVSFML